MPDPRPDASSRPTTGGLPRPRRPRQHRLDAPALHRGQRHRERRRRGAVGPPPGAGRRARRQRLRPQLRVPGVALRCALPLVVAERAGRQRRDRSARSTRWPTPGSAAPRSPTCTTASPSGSLDPAGHGWGTQAWVDAVKAALAARQGARDDDRPHRRPVAGPPRSRRITPDSRRRDQGAGLRPPRSPPARRTAARCRAGRCANAERGDAEEAPLRPGREGHDRRPPRRDGLHAGPRLAASNLTTRSPPTARISFDRARQRQLDPDRPTGSAAPAQKPEGGGRTPRPTPT